MIKRIFRRKSVAVLRITIIGCFVGMLILGCTGCSKRQMDGLWHKPLSPDRFQLSSPERDVKNIGNVSINDVPITIGKTDKQTIKNAGLYSETKTITYHEQEYEMKEEEDVLYYFIPTGKEETSASDSGIEWFPPYVMFYFTNNILEQVDIMTFCVDTFDSKILVDGKDIRTITRTSFAKDYGTTIGLTWNGGTGYNNPDAGPFVQLKCFADKIAGMRISSTYMFQEPQSSICSAGIEQNIYPNCVVTDTLGISLQTDVFSNKKPSSSFIDDVEELFENPGIPYSQLVIFPDGSYQVALSKQQETVWKEYYRTAISDIKGHTEKDDSDLGESIFSSYLDIEYSVDLSQDNYMSITFYPDYSEEMITILQKVASVTSSLEEYYYSYNMFNDYTYDVFFDGVDQPFISTKDKSNTFLDETMGKLEFDENDVWNYSANDEQLAYLKDLLQRGNE